MASLSRSIMEETQKLRRFYLDNGNFGASNTTDLVDQHVDGIEKLHLTPEQFFTTVIERLNAISKLDAMEQTEKDALKEIVDTIVVPQRDAFLSKTK